MYDPPIYKELKRRCDFCDHLFQKGRMVAALKMQFQGGSRDYVTIFCYNGRDTVPKCLGLWKFKYDVKGNMDWEVMTYEGKQRGGEDKNHDPALI